MLYYFIKKPAEYNFCRSFCILENKRNRERRNWKWSYGET